jgi:ferredoxin-NADP reductase
VAGLRCAGALGRWIGEQRRERRLFLASLAEFEKELQSAQQPAARPTAAWKGYRRFVVQNVIAEAADVSSIYLTPEDRRALPPFLSGQFLTVRVQVPGESAATVRCFSLSDRPRRDYYRITVKAVSLEQGRPGPRGKVSRYLNRGLRVGQVLEATAPRGEFYLRDDARPAVLIAAGIGITPLLSMAATLLGEHGDRKVILFYGVRNSREHPFDGCLSQWAATSQRLQYLPFYSQPLVEDCLRKEAALNRRLDVDAIRQTLPDPNFPFYICGPSAFMEGMVTGLRGWGVAEQDLHFEAFGPATAKRPIAKASEAAPATTSQVLFQQSGVTAVCSSAESLLEIAEDNGLSLPSGCRSGNCGLCARRLVAGQVRYETTPEAAVDLGFCLTCVARPDSPQLVLDA